MKKNLSVSLVFLLALLNCQFSKAQKSNDSTKAKSLTESADSLMALGRYNTAIEQLNAAAEIYKGFKNWKNHLTALNKAAECYWRLGDFEKSTQLSAHIITWSEQKLGTLNIHKAMAKGNKGVASQRQGNYKEAIASFKEQLGIVLNIEGDTSKTIPEIHKNIGSSYASMESFDMALHHYQQASNLYQHRSDVDNGKKGDLFYALGQSYSIMNRNDLAMDYFEKALHILNKDDKNYNTLIASIYNSMGVVFRSQGLNKSALLYYDKALKLSEKFFPYNHPRIAISLNNIGLIYIADKDYPKALHNYRTALKLQQEYHGQPHPIMAMFYNNIGLAFQHWEKYDSALHFYKKALDIQLSTFGKGHPKNFLLYYNIGETHYQKGNLKEGIAHFKYALKGPKENEVSVKSFIALGSAFQDRKKYDSALYYYQLALVDNVAEFSDSTVNSFKKLGTPYLPTYLLKALKAIGETYSAQYKIDKDQETLKKALFNFQLCDTLANDIKLSSLNLSDRLAFSESSSIIHEQAILTCLKLYEVSEEDIYKNLAFYFIEKNKGSYLLESLQQTQALNTGLIPKALATLEGNLKYNRDFIQSKLLSLNKPADKDTADIETYENKLFEVNYSYDSLIHHFRERYRPYYTLNYGNDIISTEVIQEKLDKHTALIEYFIGENNIQVVVISKNQFEVFTIRKTSLVDEQIDELLKVVSAWRTHPDEVHNFLKFQRLSHNLYELILAGPLASLPTSSDITDLVIVTDGKLAYVPFDILLTEKDKTIAIGDYRSLNYLIKDFDISYSYSSTLHFTSQPTSEQKQAEGKFIGYAPIYKAPENNLEPGLELDKFRNAISPLEWNRQEVQIASRLMNGAHRSSMQATETNFKQEAPHYKILHLAMHALVDDEDPMYSRLVFSQDKYDTLNDGYLHTYELFNMKLNPELTVLSACNTGIGKLNKGEGMMSLAYAFAYAGCPSIIMSKWPVDDESTSNLMQAFYKNLSEGMTQKTALRTAKLQLLNEPSGLYANPTYWGGFVLIENNPGDKTPTLPLWVISVVLFSIFTFMFFLLRKKRNQGR